MNYHMEEAKTKEIASKIPEGQKPRSQYQACTEKQQ